MIEKVTKSIKKEIEIFDKRYKEALSTDVKLLLKISNYILKNTGKRIRPILLLLVSKLLGEINEKTYSSCILIELLSASLLSLVLALKTFSVLNVTSNNPVV